MRVAELVPAGYNPRKITARAADGLRASLARFGELGGIVWNERTRRLVGGHQRVKALLALGVEEVDVRVVDLPTAEEKALNVTLNNPAISGEFDFEVLDVVLDDIRADLPNAFEELHLDDIRPVFAPSTGGDSSAAPGHGGGSDAEATNSRNESQNLTKGLTDPDETPEPAPEPVTRAGDVWVLGDHRIICGDSTVARDVAALIPAGTRAALLHADPPYGMGKEADGVKNDNLYAGKLDVFQMAWWRTWRPFLADNASAYVWGTAEDLWRLWYAGGLSTSERMTFRNEVVWDKANGMGMLSETHRQFATATERCLFFMLGEQGFGNVNAEDYWEGFEPIRGYLAAEAERIGLGPADVKRICGVGMFGHWFSKSQWTMIPEKHYAAIQAAAGGKAFLAPYAELRQKYDGQTSTGGHLAAKQEFYGTRAYFDNVHDNMRDVWNFDRVTGAERHGHATPKPVAMIVRAIKSSCPEGGVVLEPFNGSGTTLIAAETCGRVCYAAELTPTYVDTTVRRWQAFTGKQAVLDGDGRTFDDIAVDRGVEAAGGTRG